MGPETNPRVSVRIERVSAGNGFQPINDPIVVGVGVGIQTAGAIGELPDVTHPIGVRVHAPRMGWQSAEQGQDESPEPDTAEAG